MTALDSVASVASVAEERPVMLPRDPRARLAGPVRPGHAGTAARWRGGAQRSRGGRRAGPRRRGRGLCLRPAGTGRRHGHRGLRRDRRSLHRGGLTRRPDRGAVALGGRPAGRGGGQLARGGHGIRGDDRGLRTGAADLRGTRSRGGRCRLRPGPYRHRDPVRPGAHLRHGSGCGAVRHRRGRRHGAPGRSRAAQPPFRGGARGDRDRRGGAGPGPAAGGPAQRPGEDRGGRRGARSFRPAARLRPARL